MNTPATPKPGYPTEAEIRQAALNLVEIANQGLHDIVTLQELLKEVWKEHQGLS